MQRRTFLKTCGANTGKLLAMRVGATVAAGVSCTTLIGCASFKGRADHTSVPFEQSNGQIMISKSHFSSAQGVKVKVDEQLIGIFQLSEDNYHAVNMQCTHQGCAIDITDNVTNNRANNVTNNEPNNKAIEAGYICPCHGAKFNSTGKVLKGPATQPLTSYPVSVDTEIIKVHVK